MLIDNTPLARFKRELRKAIGNGVDYIEQIKKNVLVVSDSKKAENIERSVARIPMVDFAYYHPRKGGIVFALKG